MVKKITSAMQKAKQWWPTPRESKLLKQIDRSDATKKARELALAQVEKARVAAQRVLDAGLKPTKRLHDRLWDLSLKASEAAFAEEKALPAIDREKERYERSVWMLNHERDMSHYSARWMVKWWIAEGSMGAKQALAEYDRAHAKR